MVARPLPLSTDLDRFSLSEEADPAEEGNIEGAALEVRRAVRGRLGPGDASYRLSSPEEEGVSENFVAPDMVIKAWTKIDAMGGRVYT